MYIIPNDKIAIVDDEDFEYLNQFKWYAIKTRTSNFYAVRTGYNIKTGTGKNIYMHRDVLELTNPKIKGDHIDHNGLNNQRHNLRRTNNSGNNCNRKSAKNSSSKYLGVHFCVLKKGGRRLKDYPYWIAAIRKEGKQKRIGWFKTEKEAALAYNKAATKRHGEFANLNNI